MMDIHYLRHHVEDNPLLQEMVWEAGLHPFLLDDVDDGTIVAALRARAATLARPRRRKVWQPSGSERRAP